MLHKMKRFLKGKKNIIISEEISGVIKWSTRGEPWGKRWTHGICGFSCDVLWF